MAYALPVGLAQANSNNSGRYVVPDSQGVWQSVESGEPGQGGVFYPSWYMGVDVSKSRWDSDDFENTSTGAGLLVGNHFSPHLRWELSHRYQNPDSEFTDDEGENYTLSSFSLDYLVNKPKDGFSPVLRGGVGIANDLKDDQGEVAALLGLGMQWREDRWTVRLMAEQMGQDLNWAGMTLAGYIGGNEQKTREAMQRPAAVIEQPVAEVVPAVKIEPKQPTTDSTVAVDSTPTLEAVITPTVASIPVNPAPSVKRAQECGSVFSTREMENIEFVSGNSEILTRASKDQLTQIGKAYARRSYINVEVSVSAKTEFLAELRADSVISALNTFGVLDDRIGSKTRTGVDSLSLSMKDTRGCGV